MLIIVLMSSLLISKVGKQCWPFFLLFKTLCLERQNTYVLNGYFALLFEFLCIQVINFLSETYLANIKPHSVGSFTILMTVSLGVKKHFSFIKSFLVTIDINFKENRVLFRKNPHIECFLCFFF